MTRIHHSFIQFTLISLLGCFGGVVCFAQTAGPEGALPVVDSKEYIFQQQPGEILVVRISASEAQFRSRVSTESSGVIVQSGLHEARMLPIFQFIPSTDSTRQININVDATQVTNRTEFDMGLTRLNVRDQRTGSIASAYQTLSSGLSLLNNGSAAQWTVRIQTLFSAANQFEAIGMEEMRLWSRTFGAHLVLNQLQEYQTALDWSNELLRQPRISRYPELEFTAIKLRSSAMFQGGIGVGGSDPLNSPFQLALAETVDSARSLGFRFEESLALMSGGVDLIDHGLNRQAQGFLAAALDIAVEIEANDLAASIREHMVEAYSQVGEREATGEILADIETHLVDEGDEQELALNLIQQGQVHIEGHRYSQAIGVLERAVTLEQSELSRLQAELELGMALSASGRGEEAIVHLYRAVFNPQTGEYRSPSNVLNIKEAMYELAAIHRHQQEWERLEKIRSEQRAHLDSPTRHAVYSYHLATDALHRYGRNSSTTVDRYQRAFRQADGAGQAELRNLSRLALCALPSRRTGENIFCQPGEIRIAYQALQGTVLQDRKAEAALFYARIQDQAGRTGNAFEVIDGLIRSLIENNPQSLGSWYWYWRGSLASDFLAYAMKSEADGQSDASRSFLALLETRRLERGGGRSERRFSADALMAYLRGLPADTNILSYYLTEDSAMAWVAGRDGVRRQNLAGSARILALIVRMRSAGSWRESGQEASELGSLLLDPLASDLEPTLYLAVHAPLLGVPFDWLHVNGEPLALRHQLANIELASLEPMNENRFELPNPSSVFLGGDPQEWTGEFASRMESSDEMRTVGNFFIGPGLHVVQGVSLLSDEFTHDRYGQAELIHLSVPGRIDLSGQLQSGLFLSEPARGEGPERLGADTLEAMPLRSRLVFLSKTEFSGISQALENRKGVVSALLDAGAQSVIASLWTVDPEFRTRFVERFYNHLEQKDNIITALTLAKRDSIVAGERSDWAGFQLFID